MLIAVTTVKEQKEKAQQNINNMERGTNNKINKKFRKSGAPFMFSGMNMPGRGMNPKMHEILHKKMDGSASSSDKEKIDRQQQKENAIKEVSGQQPGKTVDSKKEQ